MRKIQSAKKATNLLARDSSHFLAMPYRVPLVLLVRWFKPKASIITASRVKASTAMTFWKICREITPLPHSQISRM